MRAASSYSSSVPAFLSSSTSNRYRLTASRGVALRIFRAGCSVGIAHSRVRVGRGLLLQSGIVQAGVGITRPAFGVRPGGHIIHPGADQATDAEPCHSFPSDPRCNSVVFVGGHGSPTQVLAASRTAPGVVCIQLANHCSRMRGHRYPGRSSTHCFVECTFAPRLRQRLVGRACIHGFPSQLFPGVDSQPLAGTKASGIRSGRKNTRRVG